MEYLRSLILTLDHLNRRSSGLKPSRVLQGFINFKSAQGLRPRTIDSYERDLKPWLTCQEDVDIAEITSRDLRDYLNYLRTEYIPRRPYGNNDKPLPPKTIRNHWISLSALLPAFRQPLRRLPRRVVFFSKGQIFLSKLPLLIDLEVDY